MRETPQMGVFQQPVKTLKQEDKTWPDTGWLSI